MWVRYFPLDPSDRSGFVVILIENCTGCFAP
jgi:hypothetical protein